MQAQVVSLFDEEGQCQQLVVQRFCLTVGISQPYTLELTGHLVTADTCFQPKMLQAIAFTLPTGSLEIAQQISGILWSVKTSYDPNQDQNIYQLQIVPPLKLFENQRQLQIISAITLPELIAQLWLTLPADQAIPYELHLRASRQKQAFTFITRYHDNDLACLQSLATYGIQYYFDFRAKDVPVVFIDSLSILPTMDYHLAFDPRLVQVPGQRQAKAFGSQAIYRRKITSQALRFFDAAASNLSWGCLLGKEAAQIQESFSQQVTAATLSELTQIRQLQIQAGKEENWYYVPDTQLLVGTRIQYGLGSSVQNDAVVTQQVLMGETKLGVWSCTSQVRLDRVGVEQCETAAPAAQALPGHSYGVALTAHPQVTSAGDYMTVLPQLDQFVESADNKETALPFRDIQGSVTGKGGVSHAPDKAGELLLTTVNGQSQGSIIIGGIANAASPNVVSNYNESNLRLQNQGGVSLLAKQRDNSDPHHYWQVSVNNSANQPAGFRQGSKYSPLLQGVVHGAEEFSSGFSQQQVHQNYVSQVAAHERSRSIYQFLYHQDTERLLGQAVSVDSYSERYYSQPIGQADTAPLQPYISSIIFSFSSICAETFQVEMVLSLEPKATSIQAFAMSLTGGEALESYPKAEKVVIKGLDKKAVFEATLQVKLITGEQLELPLQWSYVEWLAQLAVHFTEISGQQCKAAFSWQVASFYRPEAEQFTCQCIGVVNQSMVIPISESGICIEEALSGEPFPLQLTLKSAKQTLPTWQVRITVPDFTENKRSTANQIASVSHMAENGCVFSTYHIPQTAYYYPSQVAQIQTHQENNWHLLQADNLLEQHLLSGNVNDYLQHFDRQKYWNSWGLDSNFQQAPVMGASIQTVYVKNHLGDWHYTHLGTEMVQVCLKSKQQLVFSPLYHVTHTGPRYHTQVGQTAYYQFQAYMQHSQQETAQIGTYQQIIAHRSTQVVSQQRQTQTLTISSQQYQNQSVDSSESHKVQISTGKLINF